ncbi:uncharacterized protein PG998_003941 [Apiospora kogelbergensis]|uniref:uncharacterized protein n=1 Tax=Apiospora kogelbergensis TaxID=1337665 RepID=UPI00312F2807
MAKGLVASSSSDTDVKQLRLGEMPNFPLFSKLPPELRHTIWDMAAEVGFEVNLEQSCRCSFKSGQVRLNVTSQLMHVLRQRLALLHACQEARSLLAPDTTHSLTRSYCRLGPGQQSCMKESWRR